MYEAHHDISDKIVAIIFSILKQKIMLSDYSYFEPKIVFVFQ
jgi:hypothetical protein